MMLDLALVKRGVVDFISEDELLSKVKEKGVENIVVKYGADPTSKDLHLGHTVPLRKLRQLQEMGMQIVFLIGDFTAMVGDPTGRNKTRPPLSEGEIRENARTYLEQVGKILDVDKIKVVRNSEWFADMKLPEFIKIAANYTVARMIERDDFAKRLKEGIPIFMHEIMYPLLQGYDSVVLKADVEVGGSDQLFNFIVARELQKAYSEEPEVVITMPLLVGLDGKAKMSKSYGNYVAINDDPDTMFGKIMSIPDDLMWDWWLLLTDESEDKIEKMKREVEAGKNPRDIKLDLARTITSQFWGEVKAKEAQEKFIKVFSRRNFEDMAIEVKVKPGEKLIDLLVRIGFASSRSEARRLVKQGGVSIGGVKQTDPFVELKFEDGVILKVGKRRFAKLFKE